MYNQNKYLVDIRCFTFQHVNYISDALNGFCIQKTSFPFIILVVDDASTDGEQEVIYNYMSDHFNVTDEGIAWRRETEDGVYSYAQHKTNKNCFMMALCLRKNLHAIKGAKMKLIAEWRNSCKYEALCEGDDYWTDPLKLQRQVDFLEEHEEYSMCFHKVVIESEMPEEWQKHFFDHLEERTYTARDIYDNWCVPTCSVLYRKDRLHYKQNKNIVFGDIYTWLLLAETGKLYCLPFAGGVYRRHQGSASCAYDVQTSVKLFWQYKFFEKRFPELKDISRRKQEDQGLKCIIYAPYFDGIWKYRFRYMFRHPKLFFSSFFTGTLLQYTKFRHH